MPRDGSKTRNLILEKAQQMVLDVGLSGVSVDTLIEAAGVTRGTFFYHFKTKHDMAAALVERYANEDRDHFNSVMQQAELLSRDPLQQLLIFLGLFIEFTEQMEEPFPGCLYASYCYQSGAISPEVMAKVEVMVRFWRSNLQVKLESLAEQYPPCIPVELSQVADHVMTSMEGAFILSKLVHEPKLASEQLIHCRNYIELLFSPS
ncbi:MAG: TetR/AcrR family transcriptional regulator [Halopseudomonas sp.]